MRQNRISLPLRKISNLQAKRYLLEDVSVLGVSLGAALSIGSGWFFRWLSVAKDVKEQRLRADRAGAARIERRLGRKVVTAHSDVQHSLQEIESRYRGMRGDLPLHDCARTGRNVVEELNSVRVSDKLAYIKSPNHCGSTALHEAASGEEKEIVSLLLEVNSCALQANDTRWFSPILQFFKRKGEGGGRGLLNLQTRDGWTPLMCAIQYDREGSFDLILSYALSNRSLEEPLAINAQNNVGMTVAHFAAQPSSFDYLGRLMRAYPEIDLRIQNSLGETPLHLAAKKDNLEAIRVISKNKNFFAVLNSVATFSDGRGQGTRSPRLPRTAFQEACANGYEEVVRFLLTFKELDVELHNVDGRSALDFVLATTENVDKQFLEDEVVKRFLTIRECLVRWKHLSLQAKGSFSLFQKIDMMFLDKDKQAKEFIKLLEEQIKADEGSRQKKDKFGRGIMHYAVRFNSKAVLEEMMRLGFSVDEKSGGVTPLYEACFYGCQQSVDFLLQHGARPEFIRESNGWSCLMLAAWALRPGIIRLLLDKIRTLDNKAVSDYINAKNKRGDSILFVLLTTLQPLESYQRRFKRSDEDIQSSPYYLRVKETFELLLENECIDLNMDADSLYKRNSLLHLVAEYGYVYFAETLANRGVQYAPNGNSSTPLHIAVFFGKEKMVSFLANRFHGFRDRLKDQKLPIDCVRGANKQIMLSILKEAEKNTASGKDEPVVLSDPPISRDSYRQRNSEDVKRFPGREGHLYRKNKQRYDVFDRSSPPLDSYKGDSKNRGFPPKSPPRTTP